MAENRGTKQIAVNRQARHEYFVEETLEAGIELFGTEVKSLRNGGINLKEAGAASSTASCSPDRCTSAPTKKGIFSTAIRCGPKSCCCTVGS